MSSFYEIIHFLLIEDGDLYTWGTGVWGTLGDGEYGSGHAAYSPYLVTALDKPVVDVAAGEAHCLAITSILHFYFYFLPSKVMGASMDGDTTVMGSWVSIQATGLQFLPLFHFSAK